MSTRGAHTRTAPVSAEMRLMPGVLAEPDGGSVANQMSLGLAGRASQLASQLPRAQEAGPVTGAERLRRGAKGRASDEHGSQGGAVVAIGRGR